MIKVTVDTIDYVARTPVANAFVDVKVKVKSYLKVAEEEWEIQPPVEEFTQSLISTEDGTFKWEIPYDYVESNLYVVVEATADLSCAGLRRTVEINPQNFSGTGSVVDAHLVFELDFAKAIVGDTTHDSTRLWFWLHYPCPPGYVGVCRIQVDRSRVLDEITPPGLKGRTGRGLPDAPAERATKEKKVDFAASRIFEARPELGHVAVVDFDGLAPATRYTYVLSLEQAQTSSMPVKITRGEFTTAPRDADKLTFVFGSCHLPVEGHAEDVEGGALNRWSALAARRDYEMMLLIGDQIYADLIREKWPNDEWFTRFVKRYDQLWTYPDVRKVFLRTPTYMILDDHDIKDDWGTVPVDPTDDDTDKNFIAEDRLAWGKQAYRVFQQYRNPPTISNAPELDGWFYHFKRGPAAFFLLDGRSKRRPPQGVQWKGEDVSYVLGAAQRQAFDNWVNDPETRAADVIVLVAPVPLAFLPVNDVTRLLDELKKAAESIGSWKGAKEGAKWGRLAALGGALAGGAAGFWYGKHEAGDMVEEIYGRKGFANLTDRDLADLWTCGPNQSDLQFLLDRLFRLAKDPRRRSVFVLGGDVHLGAMHRILSDIESDTDIFQLTSSPISISPPTDEAFRLVVEHISESAHITEDLVKKYVGGGTTLDEEVITELAGEALGKEKARFTMARKDYSAELVDLLTERNFGRFAVERVLPNRRIYRFYLSIEAKSGNLFRAIQVDLDRPGEPKELSKGLGILEFDHVLSAVKVHPAGEAVGNDGWPFHPSQQIVGVGDLDGDGIDEIVVEQVDEYRRTAVMKHDGDRWSTVLRYQDDWVDTPQLDPIMGFGDFDGDQAEEVVTTNSQDGIKIVKFRDGKAEILASIPNGTSIGGWTFNYLGSRFAGIGDVNGDGKAEILLTGDQGICVLHLSTAGRLEPMVCKPSDTWFGGWRFNSGADRIEGLGDFDGDGALEVVVSSEWGIGMLKQSGDTFGAYFAHPTGTRFGGWRYDREQNKIAGFGRFSGATKAGHAVDEILITSGWGIGVLNLSDDSLTLDSRALQPNGTRFGRWRYDAGADQVRAIADLNGDGRDEILLANQNGIGLISLSGVSFDCLDQQPFGTLIGNWKLEANDRLAPGRALTRGRKRQILIQAALRI